MTKFEHMFLYINNTSLKDEIEMLKINTPLQ